VSPRESASRDAIARHWWWQPIFRFNGRVTVPDLFRIPTLPDRGHPGRVPSPARSLDSCWAGGEDPVEIGYPERA
jgi:hypothetical protein